MENSDSAYWPLTSEAQLRLLYDKYSKSLYQRAFVILREQYTTEEAVQDVFISVWQNRKLAATEVQNLEPYLYGILKHKTFDRLRKIIRDKVIAYVDTEQTYDPINEWHDHKEMALMLNNLLNKLPEKQREIYRLIKLEGLKREEVAQKLGISAHTVKNHLLAATKFLKENIDLLLLIYASMYLSEKIMILH